MRNVGLSVFTVMMLGLALPAAAQDLPKMDVGIGYQAAKASDPDGWYRYGFNADGSVPINESWSILAELGWARHSIDEVLTSPNTGEQLPSTHANFNFVNYGGGLRWNRRSSESMTPFAQIVVGVQRDTFDTGSGVALGQLVNQKFTANNVMVQPGAGIVIPINETIGVVGQVDYRRVFSDDGANVVRFVIGMRFNQR